LVDSPSLLTVALIKGIQELLAMIQFLRRIHKKSKVESFPKACSALVMMIAAALLMVWANGVWAQQNGPMPAATASDQPAPAQSSANSSSAMGAHPNLAGTWKLNKDQSDDVREKMQEAGAGGGGQGGQGGGQGGGWGGGNGGGYGGRGGGGMGGGRRGGGEGGMMQDYSQLAIEQTASTVKVTGASGRVLATYDANASGSTSNNSSNSGANSSTSGGNGNGGDNQGGQGERNAGPAAVQWQDAKLVATEQGRRGTTTRTYELSPDGKQLYVTTRIDNPRFSQPVTIRFVYDSQKAGG
jgi:hypothetical protein